MVLPALTLTNVLLTLIIAILTPLVIIRMGLSTAHVTLAPLETDVVVTTVTLAVVMKSAPIIVCQTFDRSLIINGRATFMIS